MARYLLPALLAAVCLSAPAYADSLLNQLTQPLTQPLMQTQAQVNLIPSGQCNLLPGQYMLTNLTSGQSLYVVISQNGQLLAQDPRILQFNVQQLSQQQVQQVQQQAQTQTQTGQKSGLGGMLKQGLGNFLQNELMPANNTGH